MNKEELYNIIDRYFEAQLSHEEEHELLYELLKCESRDPYMDEALAVMSASRLQAQDAAPRRRPARLLTGIAAGVAAVLAIGALIFHQMPSRDSEMIAYVGGVRIENPQEIMNIIDTQLNDIGESSEFFTQIVSADLDDIRDALNTEDI